MKTRKSIKSTVAIGKGMLVAALALNGFEINAEKTSKHIEMMLIWSFF